MITGNSCEQDYNGCQDNPCTLGTNCTDVTPSVQEANATSYSCSPCPSGTEDNDGTCFR